MKLPKAKALNAEKYVAGLSLFKQKFAKIKLSANEWYKNIPLSHNIKFFCIVFCIQN